MNKVIYKIIICLVILMMCFIYIVPNKVNADTLGEIDANSIQSWTYNNPDVIEPTQNVMATAIKVMQIVCLGIAVISLLMIAIKYMSAAPQDKADFKKSATGYIVGAVVMFGTSGILAIIQKFAQNIA